MTGRDNQPQGPGKPIVLIVDDVPDNLSTISEMISDLGVDVRVANSGPVAIRYARLAPRPDLILLDVMMPDMDGHEVLRILRCDDDTRNIPVIFVTALDDPDNEERGIQEGAVDYITKPINPAVLGIRVKAQLELKRARDIAAGQRSGWSRKSPGAWPKTPSLKPVCKWPWQPPASASGNTIMNA